MNDNSANLTPPPVGDLIITIEVLNMQVHVLERALAGMAAFATPEQRMSVQRLVDRSSANYSPILGKWPKMEATMQRNMAKVVEAYKRPFSA